MPHSGTSQSEAAAATERAVAAEAALQQLEVGMESEKMGVAEMCAVKIQGPQMGGTV